MKTISVEEMRRADAYTIENLIPSKELMFRAGKAVYDLTEWHGKTGIICGGGNNAGDGYVIAGLLKEAGFDPVLILTGEKWSADGRYFYDKCRELGVREVRYNEALDFNDYDMLVDCIYGTGFKGEVNECIAGLIRKANNSKAVKISVDINSGMNGDTGEAEICMDSDITVAIGYAKHGQISENAARHMKKLEVADIGIVLVESTKK